MDRSNNKINEERYGALDFIFSLIRVHHTIESSFIAKNYKTELQYHKIGDGDLRQLLEYMVIDKKIYVDKGAYRVMPVAITFRGYQHQAYEMEQSKKKESTKDKTFKIIPIILTFLFGVCTATLGIVNLQRKNEIARKDMLIDSLKQIVAFDTTKKFHKNVQP